MELNFKLGFEQLLYLVKQLPTRKKKELAAALHSDLNKKGTSSDLQKLLLKGPTWNNNEYKAFIKRKSQVDKFPGL